MKFLDGFKTIVGLVGTAVTVLLPSVAPEVAASIGDQVVSISQGVFGLLAALGIIHKVEKAKAAP